MMADLELTRLLTRYAANRGNPNWTPDMLAILRAAIEERNP